ncbi:MAG: AlpA family phage regulatory protein [Rhodanobacteraceae bacterium]|nr:AlpA family phage regulatory protein [Rhodanobacteraceae bacterium]MBP9153775.1 AlpA family phage regulatory protein [Xanthomonadales bacterium]
MMQEKLVRLPDVCAAVGMRKGGVYKAIREGRFPAPIKLGKRAVAWPESSVQSWIAARIAEAGKVAA